MVEGSSDRGVGPVLMSSVANALILSAPADLGPEQWWVRGAEVHKHARTWPAPRNSGETGCRQELGWLR